MQNFKLYTKSEVMKMALEIEGDICDVILKHVDEIDEQMKMLYTANRFKSAIYERLGLSLEEFNKICDDVITEREKANQMATIKELQSFCVKMIEKGYGDYEILQGYDANYAFAGLNINDAYVGKESTYIILSEEDYGTNVEETGDGYIKIK